MLKNNDRPELLRAVGQTIATRRQLLVLTQQQLADAVGIHRTYLSEIEQGKRNISIGTLHEIAIRLETTAANLLKQADKSTSLSKPENDQSVSSSDGR